MNEREVIQKTENYVREKLDGEGTGHDWWHIQRVWKSSIEIAKKENANLFVVELAALLHDIADWKFNDGDISVGGKIARDFLEKQGVNEETISHVCNIIDTTSFKGAGEEKPMLTVEGKIVRDADRLDAIGAIGVARCFAYGGSKNRPLYNPEGKARDNLTFEEYKKGGDSSLHHFYEKLLFLKDLMLTETGKRMAEERHKFMENYLEQFYKEWEGKS